ncbi:right-handed parallel beta-helix repeat-containing protein [Paenibacillus sp. FSL R5-0810]|uniref:right-handed parallel beta-helix repeat-containing protein n=1 Tax=Paenibacillus sp. FSL R5-0810 TaxID=2921659 RepID=UPI0030F673A3
MATVINVPADQPTITAAIAAASPFDTIRVAPGIYNEIVIVNKPVQLLGAQAGIDARNRPGTAAAESIITGTSASGIVQITNERVVVDGFIIQNNTAGPGISSVGTGSGYWIFNNIIRNNVFGIYLLSNGALETQVRYNFFFSNNQTGAANGNGLLSESGSNFWIDNNLFSGHLTASVNLSPTLLTGVSAIVSNNRMVTDNSIALTNTTNVKIADNILTNTQGSAIFFGGNTAYTDIEGNVIQNGISNGVNVTTAFVAAPNTNIRMKNNTISGNSVSGLNLPAGAYAVGGANLPLDATNNWWGSPSGPSPIGTGDAVIDPSGFAVITPFLTAPPNSQVIPQSVLTTGPIMVASSPIRTAAALILNDDPLINAQVTVTAFDLSTGVKAPFNVFNLTVPPQNVRYLEVPVGFTYVYEIVFNVTGTNQVAISVWNLDAMKVQITGQHLVASEEFVLQRLSP